MNRELASRGHELLREAMADAVTEKGSRTSMDIHRAAQGVTACAAVV